MAMIGFIGLGNMGRPMVRNLLKAGHSVRAHDVVAASREAAAQDGATVVGEGSAVLEGADAVITMLPAGEHVRSVYLGANGLLAKCKAKPIFIDCSTIDVGTARDVARAAADAGLEMVDAPVSGGVGGAAAGTLTIMVGGDGPVLCARQTLSGAFVPAGGACGRIGQWPGRQGVQQHDTGHHHDRGMRSLCAW